MNVEVADISLIESNNKSIVKAVKYCNDRGIKVEVVKDPQSAKGVYLCQIDEDTFYEDYYLQIQYITLEHSIKKCDSFRYKSVIVYDKPYQEFYIGENNSINFYRRKKGLYKDRFQHPEGAVYDEFDYMPGCTLEQLRIVENRELDISNEKLIEYDKYFTSIFEPENVVN